MKILSIILGILLFAVITFAQVSWEEVLPPTVNPNTLGVSSNSNVYAVFEYSLIRSTDNGQSWEDVYYAPAGSAAFGTSPTGVIYLFTDSLRKSTDEGNTWITLNIPATIWYDPYPIVVNGAGDIFIQINIPPQWDTYRSTDEGNSWVTIGADSSIMRDIVFKDNLCIASFWKTGGYLYKSSNNGDDWEIIPTAPTKLYTLFAAKNGKLYGGRIFGGSPPGNLFTSSDNGINWELVSEFNTLGVYDIEENQFGHIFVATGYGVYRSTDDGNSWQPINSGLNHTPSFKLAVDSLGYIYVGTGLPQMLYGTIQSTIPVELISFSIKQIDDNVHLNWQTATELNNHGFEIERKTENNDWRIIGFKEGNGTTTKTQFYSFNDENISSGKYQYRLKQIDYDGTFEYSKTVEVEVLVINNFVLQQNYPNPFNPSTIISYRIPVKSKVVLKVFDVLGNEVATLINEEKSAGSYEVEFDGSEFTSGIYLYKLQAGEFVETKKMVFMK